MRSPAWGSPLTSSTRSRSRTPLITTTARLLIGDASPGSGSACNSTTTGPARTIGTSIEVSRLIGAAMTSGRSPSRRMVRRAVRRAATVAAPGPRSSTDTFSVTLRPTRPKDGASTIRSRRSVSSPAAGISTCMGAGSSALSCTWPSVRAMMPARRERGISASVRLMAAKRVVPSCPVSGTSTVLTSRSGILAACARICARAASATAARLPTCMEAERSVTTTAISGRVSRVSRTRRGPLSHAIRTAKASARHTAPRARRTRAGTSARAQSVARATIAHQGMAGSKRSAAIACSSFMGESPLRWGPARILTRPSTPVRAHGPNR